MKFRAKKTARLNVKALEEWEMRERALVMVSWLMMAATHRFRQMSPAMAAEVMADALKSGRFTIEAEV